MNTKKKRAALFAAGILVYGFATSLMTVPKLGISPIPSVGYALTYILGLSLGTTQLMVNTTMVCIQIAWLRRAFKPIQLLQLPVALAFSVVIDATMPLARLIGGASDALGYRMLIFLLSLPVMALGLTLLLQANFVLLPGDGVAKTAAVKTGKPFGTMKMTVDCLCVAATCALSLTFLHRIEGLQIGTVIAALTMGRMVRWMTGKLERK